MKKLILPFLTVLFFFSCEKDNGPTDKLNEISSFIRTNYTEDAQRLLLRRIQNGEALADNDKPEFNATELNHLLSDIQAVYNLNTPQTDSIFNIVKIHTFPNPNLRYISMQVNAATAEGKLISSYKPSGNAAYDQLISQYGFTYTISTVVPNNDFAEIKSDKPYNLVALANAFKKFPFIVNAQLEGGLGDGNNITYNKDILLDFSIGTGDCLSGCMIRKGWIYKVVNGKATLVKTY